MKELALILLLSSWFCAVAQDRSKSPVYMLNGKQITFAEVSKIDSNRIRIIYASMDKNSGLYSSHQIPDTIFIQARTKLVIRDGNTPPEGGLLVVDGKIYLTPIFTKKFLPDNTIEIKKLSANQAMPLYGSDAANGAILITTKEFATETYKKRYSKLSGEYKRYLRKNKNDDSSIAYKLNDQLFYKDSNMKVEALYFFNEDLIKRIQFDKSGSPEHGPLLTIFQKF